jgi:2-methylcitrate dehydratase
VADAHPLGAKPWTRPDYVRKFDTLTEGIITEEERKRFLEIVQNIADLDATDLHQLNVQIPLSTLKCSKRDYRGIF